MIKRHKVVLLGLLAVAYGCIRLVAQHYFSDEVLSKIRALEPQNAAAVRAMPVGSTVLVEGIISPSNVQKHGTLVAYVSSSPVEVPNQEPTWIEDEWVTPPLTLLLTDGPIQIARGYRLQETTQGKPTKTRYYSGFGRRDKVFAVGTVVQPGIIQAERLCGGSRDNFLSKGAGEKWSTYFISFFTIALGTLMIGLKLWLGRS